MLVGGAGVAVLLLIAIVVLSDGSSGGRGHDGPDLIGSGPLTPAQARRVKKLGIEEMNTGEGYYRRAGTPGSSGEMENLALAKDHLIRAQDHLTRAMDALPGDYDLASRAEQCSKLLYGAQKRLIYDVR